MGHVKQGRQREEDRCGHLFSLLPFCHRSEGGLKRRRPTGSSSCSPAGVSYLLVPVCHDFIRLVIFWIQEIFFLYRHSRIHMSFHEIFSSLPLPLDHASQNVVLTHRLFQSYPVVGGTFSQILPRSYICLVCSDLNYVRASHILHLSVSVSLSLLHTSLSFSL